MLPASFPAERQGHIGTSLAQWVTEELKRLLHPPRLMKPRPITSVRTVVGSPVVGQSSGVQEGISEKIRAMVGAMVGGGFVQSRRWRQAQEGVLPQVVCD